MSLYPESSPFYHSLNTSIRCGCQTELLDEFDSEHEIHPDSPEGLESEIGFRSATFSWSNESATGAATPSKRRFRLRIDDELLFKRGRINLIVGSTGLLSLARERDIWLTRIAPGSGKTSLLMALLGEIFPELFYALCSPC